MADLRPQLAERRPFRDRLLAVRGTLAISAFVLLGLAAFGVLAWSYAVPGFAAIAAAALLGRGGPLPSRAGAVQKLVEPARDGTSVENVIRGFPDPVIVLDGIGRVVAFNAAASTMAPALRRGEAVSLALRAPEVVEAIRRAVAGAGGQRVEFSERVPVDRWLAAHVTPIELAEPAGAGRGLVLTFQDLTPLRRVEEMRADFVANASHELRTPLASLSGFIDTLQGSARDDAQARNRFLDIMKAQATRMARLIDDLLSLSRIELRAHLQPQTFVDLVAIVRQVADGLQMLARDRDVEIKIDMPPVPLMVRGDRDELIRVFENLIENALK